MVSPKDARPSNNTKVALAISLFAFGSALAFGIATDILHFFPKWSLFSMLTFFGSVGVSLTAWIVAIYLDRPAKVVQ